MSASERFIRAWHVGARTQRKRGKVVTTYLVLDGNGSIVAELPEDFHSYREQSANADLICDSVNRIDYLRDLVRRLADALEATIRNFDPRAEEVLADPNNLANCILREAKAALLEETK